jgi:hypothetical protein
VPEHVRQSERKATPRGHSAETPRPTPAATPVPVQVPQFVPRLIDLEGELHPFRRTIERQLAQRIGGVPSGRHFYIVSTPDVSRRLILEPRTKRNFERLGAHDFGARLNPVIGIRNLGLTIVGIAVAGEAFPIAALIVAEAAVPVAVGVSATATATTAAATEGVVIPLFGTVTTETLMTVAAEETTRRVAAAAGVLLILALGSDEARAETGDSPELGEIRAIPAELAVPDGRPTAMGTEITFEGRRYVIVGRASTDSP